jgi:hypothetical protein
MQARVPDRVALEQVFRLKYGLPGSCGWGPAMRWRAGYFGPDDWYEALVASLIVPGTAWLDDSKPYLAKGPTGLLTIVMDLVGEGGEIVCTARSQMIERAPG